MNASKEEARKAIRHLWEVAETLDEATRNGELVDGVDFVESLKRKLLCVQDFVKAAERKLPTEAAYAKEQNRKKRVRKQPA
jgi:hypothetical protein